MKLTTFLATAVALTGAAQAAVLITVDITNPAAVVFTARAGNSQGVSEDTLNSDGVTLLGFFSTHTVMPFSPFVTGSTLTVAGSGLAYNSKSSSSFVNNSLDRRDLNLVVITFEGEGTATQNFQTNVNAFTGSATGDDFSGLNFSAIGSTGNIVSGYSSNFPTHGVVIGQWQIIPEPSTALLGGVALLGLARRKR